MGYSSKMETNLLILILIKKENKRIKTERTIIQKSLDT